MAMSLKAKVGPFDKASTNKPSPKGRNGTISLVPKTASVYVLLQSAFKSFVGMSSMNSDKTSNAKAA